MGWVVLAVVVLAIFAPRIAGGVLMVAGLVVIAVFAADLHADPELEQEAAKRRMQLHEVELVDLRLSAGNNGLTGRIRNATHGDRSCAAANHERLCPAERVRDGRKDR